MIKGLKKYVGTITITVYVELIQELCRVGDLGG